MDCLDVRLFGRFSVRRNGLVAPNTDLSKVQELFSYLLINRARPHHRETLAGTLWGENRPDQARKYLRQTIWQLQTALGSETSSSDPPILVTDSHWVHLDSSSAMYVDMIELERAFGLVRDIPGHALSAQQAREIQRAVGLYQGHLLEGWYQDWCLFERERLQTIYLILLEKLMTSCCASGAYEFGISYGHQILSHDRAREQTHRKLMYLYAMSGDRSAALRQYERCVTALADELDAPPAQRTIALRERIRMDQLPDASTMTAIPGPISPATLQSASTLPDVAAHLRQARAVLENVSLQLRRDLDVVERRISERLNPDSYEHETERQTP